MYIFKFQLLKNCWFFVLNTSSQIKFDLIVVLFDILLIEANVDELLIWDANSLQEMFSLLSLFQFGVESILAYLFDSID